MDKVDITIYKLCSTCHTEIALEAIGSHNALHTITPSCRIEMHIGAHEFLPCSICGSPMRLCIKARPYELANHLDTPVALALYRQQQEQS